MGIAITLMNAKGGVGKSTIAVALPEVLCHFHNKNVLIIDSDSQMSSSFMTQTPQFLVQRQSDGFTILNYLDGSLTHRTLLPWEDYITHDVSDVDETEMVSLLQGHLELMLFERSLSENQQYNDIRSVIRGLLDHLKSRYDFIFIDCPPGISVLTEAWLREADCYISPVKPDFLSVSGLQMLRAFQSRDPSMGFAQNLGTLVNMKDDTSDNDNLFHSHLNSDPESYCFSTAIPRSVLLQNASQNYLDKRSFIAKYPGPIGSCLRALADEVIVRVSEIEAVQERGTSLAQ
ncbi:MAG: ParA family protein [Pseudomonadota bacterium]